MLISEFQRAQTVRLITEIAQGLSQSGVVARVVAQAEAPPDGPIPIPNVELLTEEAEAQGLHFVLHKQLKGDVAWYVGLISSVAELDEQQLAECLQVARNQEKNPGA